MQWYAHLFSGRERDRLEHKGMHCEHVVHSVFRKQMIFFVSLFGSKFSIKF